MPHEPITALDKVLHLSMLVAADMARFEKESGLSAARIRVLWELARGPATQQALARAIGVTPRNVTGLVDGLVASGHVTREPHPTDRRATHVTPTRLGARVLVDLQESHADLAEQLFGDLSARRLGTFAGVLDSTIARFAALMEEAS